MNKRNIIILFTLIAGILIASPAFSASYAGLGLSRVDASASGYDVGDANGFTIYGGNRFNQTGFEISYTDVGDIDVPHTSITTTGSIIKIQAAFFADLSKEFLFLAKLGIAIPDLKTNTGWSYNDTRTAWALGMNYQINNRLGFRMEYEDHNDMDGLDLNLLTFSLNTNF